MSITPSSLPAVQTLPGWICLERRGTMLGRSTVLASPFPFPRASSVRNYGALMAARMLPRPQSPVGDYRVIRTFKLGSEIEIDCDELAGGSIDDIRFLDRPLLNTWRGWNRGWQVGLAFIRNAIQCFPRTGGSVYSGERGTHFDWSVQAAPPGIAIGTLDGTLAAYADHERQGAWCAGVGLSEGILQIATIPIELDPDGFSGGVDHGIIEAGESADPAPEQLLPVLYHGILVRQSLELVAPGVVKVTVALDVNTDDGELVLGGAWQFDPIRIHLRGEDTRTLFRANGVTTDLTTELIPGGGGATFSDLGQSYELDRQVVRRGATTYATNLGDWWSGALIKEQCGCFIALRMADDGVFNRDGKIPATRSWRYADRTDLAGDARDGERHHFLGARYQMTESVLRAGTTVSMYFLLAETLDDMEAKLDALPEPELDPGHPGEQQE